MIIGARLFVTEIELPHRVRLVAMDLKRFYMFFMSLVTELMTMIGYVQKIVYAEKC